MIRSCSFAVARDGRPLYSHAHPSDSPISHSAVGNLHESSSFEKVEFDNRIWDGVLDTVELIEIILDRNGQLIVCIATAH